LLYEGEYKGGKRDGKGKEFSKGKVIFEGDWKEGKRWNGEGKEYNEKGQIVNEKTYENGNIQYEKYLYYVYQNDLVEVKEFFKGTLIYDGSYKFEKNMKEVFRGNIII
jgi:antitoxin component YwqK of YwqJK toxin-antitoxin module